RTSARSSNGQAERGGIVQTSESRSRCFGGTKRRRAGRRNQTGLEAQHRARRRPSKNHPGLDKASPVRRRRLSEPGPHWKQRTGEGGGRVAINGFGILQQGVSRAHEVQSALPGFGQTGGCTQVVEQRVLPLRPVRPTATR